MIIQQLLFLIPMLIISNCNGVLKMELLGRKEGRVGNENFTYYYIHHFGTILLLLQSNVGDADMYISETNMIPTYNPESYDLHSATCGIDIIDIPNSFKSPISVGIYGNSAYQESSYVLEIFKSSQEDSEEATSSFLIIEEGNPEGIPEIKVVPKDEKGKLSIRSKSKKKLYNVSAKVGGIFSLFEIIELIFL